MDCHECGRTQVLHDLQLLQPNTFNVYDLRCICGRDYCGVCGLSSHFPALCQERTMWQESYMDRDQPFWVIYEHMLANIVERRNMQGWRDQFGHAQYDGHLHMRFAVDELSRASSIHSWVRVTAHFSPIHGNILQSPRFVQMIDRHTALSNAVIATMNAQPPLFGLGPRRVALCEAVMSLLSLLCSERQPNVMVYPAHFNEQMINYYMNFQRALGMWLLFTQR